MAKPLNNRQLHFVACYLKSGNATQSYIEAGYKGRGRSAGNAASRLLADPRLRALLTARSVEQVRGIEITRDQIRLEMARVAFVSVKNLFHPDGRPRAVSELDDDTAAALASFEVEEVRQEGKDGRPGAIVRTTKYKLWDKNRALQTLADTEPGVWADDAKGKGSAVSVNVGVQYDGRFLSTLKPEDLAELDRILAGFGVVDRVEVYTAAFEKAAGREAGNQLDPPRPSTHESTT